VEPEARQSQARFCVVSYLFVIIIYTVIILLPFSEEMQILIQKLFF
jgi:hypothetical protein